MSKPENPLAFPDETDTGMTLRDWFAGQALSGMLSDSSTVRAIGVVSDGDGRGEGSVAAEMAYGYADAMLKERSK